eukprot:jgi/Mesen1/8877/ME000530S08284
MSSMKEKAAHAVADVKEKTHEVTAKLTGKKEHAKADVHEKVDKAHHPNDPIAKTTAEAKADAHKAAATGQTHQQIGQAKIGSEFDKNQATAQRAEAQVHNAANTGLGTGVNQPGAGFNQPSSY